MIIKYQGKPYKFPDGTSDEEISSTLQKEQSLPEQSQPSSQQSNADRLYGLPGFKGTLLSDVANVGAGLLNQGKSFLQAIPDLQKMVPQSMQNAFLYKQGQRPIDKFDPYKTIGVSEQPISTQAGVMQTLGEFLPVGPPAEKAYQLGKEGIEKASPYVKNIFSKFDPESQAKNIENKLSQGSNTVDENSKLLTSDVRNGYDMRNQESSIFLNHALDEAGEEQLYEKPNPLISTALDKSKKTMDSIDDLNVSDLYDKFKKNPTFNNAHWLKSELGTLIGDLEKQPIDAALRNQINLVKSARNNLESDISDFLENRDLNNNMQIGPSYQKGIDLYRENVAHYLANKKLREITRGRKTIVKNIHSIFDTPSDIVDKEGNIKIGPINKIMQDLPEQSKNRILFNAIGGKQKGSNQLLNNLQKAKNKGFGSYFTPDINEDINILNQRLLNKNRLLTGAKIATGAGLGLVAFEDLYHALK